MTTPTTPTPKTDVASARNRKRLESTEAVRKHLNLIINNAIALEQPTPFEVHFESTRDADMEAVCREFLEAGWTLSSVGYKDGIELWTLA